MANNRRGKRSAVRDNLGWIVFFAVLIAAATFVILSLFMPRSASKKEKNTPETSETTEKKTESTTEAKTTEDTEKEENNTETPENKTPKQYEGTVDGSVIPAIITHDSVDVIDGVKQYWLIVTISKILPESSTCDLSMTGENGSSLNRDGISVRENPSSSSCEFKIKTDGISSGHWDVKVTIHANNQKRELTTAVDIE